MRAFLVITKTHRKNSVGGISSQRDVVECLILECSLPPPKYFKTEKGTIKGYLFVSL